MYHQISLNPLERQSITYPYAFAHNALNSEECDAALALCNTYGLIRGMIQHGTDDTIDQKIRRSNVQFISPDDRNMWLFGRMASIIGDLNEKFYNFNLNGFDYFQFTEYLSEEEGHYNWHPDMLLGKQNTSNTMTRKLSMSIILNDDFEGGELQFHTGNYEDPIKTECKKGTAIVFPSFMHHRVTPVTKGKRYSLVVWVNGPKFI